MIPAFSVVFIVWGTVLVAFPARFAGLMRKLNRGTPAERYYWYDPNEVRRSLKLRIGYRVSGAMAIMMGLSLLGVLPTGQLLPSDPWRLAEIVTRAGAIVFSFGCGIRLVIDPAWWERAATKGNLVQDRTFRVRMVMSRILGILSIAISLFMVWSLI